ncbi:GNAT family N-acetyltransferase [Paeniglutamicibacter cryotolerans]|uniref:RimJ/RimL family protein N-acetyltransferase n=1 Tax=Paeniglutamicibacter cryotolerans TaxID=670079 RepID=A0A839QGP2_9MICC|nr:GNAT family N-acetyltransferase [Paeniglutamicibacter cryotolerans]MBB2995339.1 RimJ/RimL family protein N-acetyltransferase [Paeniglutamicibacter cryotolerans]
MEKIALATVSLELVAPCADDAEALFAACQEPRIQAWVPTPRPYTLTDAREFATSISDAGWAAGTDPLWAIRTGGHLAGLLG